MIRRRQSLPVPRGRHHQYCMYMYASERETREWILFMRERKRGGHFWKAVPPSLTKGFLKKKKEEEETVSWRTPREKQRPSSITHETKLEDDDGSLCGKNGRRKTKEPRVLLAPWPLLKAVAFSFFLSPFYYYCTWPDIPGKRVSFFYFTLLYLTYWNGIFQINFVGQDENGRI